MSELAALHATHGTRSGAFEPPSRKLQALLSGIDLYQPEIVRQQLAIARDDLRRGFSIDDVYHGSAGFVLRSAPPAVLDASNVVCLTEPRIVEALFDRVGGILILLQDENSPQCRRLVSREVSFAMLDEGRMADLKDGDHIEIEDDRTRVVSRR